MTSISLKHTVLHPQRTTNKNNSQVTVEKHGDELILSLLRENGNYDRGFRLLVQEYSERLYRHVRHMVGNHADADDVLQNCLIKVYRSIHRFEGKAKLYTWLYRIATNEALTFLDKRKRRGTSSLDNEDLGIGNQIASNSTSVGDKAELLLQRAVAELPDKQKAVFNLRYFEEMSYADISEALHTSQGALKASYHHAAKKIEAFVRAHA